LRMRPRRIRSAMRLRSYSATAPRICSRSWSCGSWLMGRSRNWTWQPVAVISSRACLQRVADWGRLAHVGEMRRLDVTDAQWQRLEPLLPPEKPRTGRPNHDHRRVVSGMLWIHRTGAPWRDLPERYGPVGTVSSRFYRWCRAGVWDRLLCALQAEADARGEIDWDLHFVDATIVRAHQHAAGARRAGAVGGGGARRSAGPIP